MTATGQKRTSVKNLNMMIFNRKFLTLLAVLFMAFNPLTMTTAQNLDLAFQVREKASLAVVQFQGRADGRLDYSEKSIVTIEEMLVEASRYSKEMSAVDQKALVELMGSYVLEVAHRQYGGNYQWYGNRSQPVLVVGEPEFSVAIMTFDKIQGRLSGDPADNIVFFYNGFSERVKKAKRGDKALYL